MKILNPCRKFLQTIGAGTAALGLASVMAPIQKLQASPAFKNEVLSDGPED